MMSGEGKIKVVKSILNDLQRAWDRLRESVIESLNFEGSNRAILYINEAMSWEVVRNLDQMPTLLLNIKSVCQQGKAPWKVIESINHVDLVLQSAMDKFYH